MTCYEHLRKTHKTTKEEFNHIKGYLYALNNDQLGRPKEKMVGDSFNEEGN